MPDRFGIQSYPNRGIIERRCMWCSWSPPVYASERDLERHMRKHQKEQEAATEASKREREIALKGVNQ